MAVLVHLAKRAPAVVSSNELMDHIWAGRVVGINALYRIIASIRRAVGDTTKDPQIIETISRQGYRLIPPIEDTIIASSEKPLILLISSTKDSTSAQKLQTALNKVGAVTLVDHVLINAKSRWRSEAKATIENASLIVFVASKHTEKKGIDLYRHLDTSHKRVFVLKLGISNLNPALMRYPMGNVKAQDIGGLARSIWLHTQNLSNSPSRLHQGTNRPSIVVLPFHTTTGLHDLADNLLTETTYNLSRNPDFFVINSGTARNYVEQPLALGEIGRELNVAYAVVCRLSQFKNKTRLTAELCATDTGHVLWSDQFVCDAQDVYEVNDELARALSAQLHTNVTRREIARVSSQRPLKANAWELYQKARRYDWSSCWLQKSIDELFLAIELEPELAAAHALLSCRMAYQIWYGDVSYLNQARMHLSVANQFAPRDPMTLVANVVVRAHLGESTQALNAAHMAIEVNPNIAELWAYLGFCRGMTGDAAGVESIAFAMRLSPKDPLRYVWHLFEVVCHTQGDRLDDALVSANRSIALNDDWFLVHMFRAAILAMLGRKTDAYASWQRAKQLNAMVSYDAMVIWLNSSNLSTTQREHQLRALRECECY